MAVIHHDDVILLIIYFSDFPCAQVNRLREGGILMAWMSIAIFALQKTNNGDIHYPFVLNRIERTSLGRTPLLRQGSVTGVILVGRPDSLGFHSVT